MEDSLVLEPECYDAEYVESSDHFQEDSSLVVLFLWVRVGCGGRPEQGNRIITNFFYSLSLHLLVNITVVKFLT